MIDYRKYENATRKELIHALSLVEKRAEKLALETKNNTKKNYQASLQSHKG